MAEWAASRDANVLDKLRTGLKDPDSGVRYWAVQGILIRGRDAVGAARDELRAALQDESPTVRIIAAWALGQHGTSSDLQAALGVLKQLARPDNSGAYAAILTLNVIDALGARSAALHPMLKTLPANDPSAPDRANGYVSRLLEHIVGVEPSKAAPSKLAGKAKKKR
jgi:uncharacterized sulfatase